MDLSREFLSAENRFQQKLESYFLSVFPETGLESHGLGHHRRVWNFAKELLFLPGTLTSAADQSFADSLIIAVYMHDIGMASDPGKKHGIHSRHFCEKFLPASGIDPSLYQTILDAVENHDDKEYRSAHTADPLLTVLSIADDLDALGYTGIYRYTEIYLKRNVSYSELGKQVIANVTARFANMLGVYGSVPGFRSLHQPRFELITGFFKAYNEQVDNYEFGTGRPSGYCGAVEMISTMIAENIRLIDLINKGLHDSDRIINQYFTGLLSEIRY